MKNKYCKLLTYCFTALFMLLLVHSTGHSDNIWRFLRKIFFRNLFPTYRLQTAVRKSYHSKQLSPELIFSQPKRPTILIWNRPWYDPLSGPSEGSMIGRCTVTYYRGRLSSADAVIFHYSLLNGIELPWPDHRYPRQLYIWWSNETPLIMKLKKHQLNKFDNFFNWTWSYHRTSDVTMSYGYRGDVLKEVELGSKAVDKLIARKKYLGIWIASKCNHTSGARFRLSYIKELIKQGIGISTYGDCFGNANQLPKRVPGLTKKVIKQHKFYFAFENALHCKDYITEKFWDKGLLSDAVPVVWGPTKEDILSVAPLDSFIFVEDFKSPRKLAEYLEFLDSNDDEYRKYFRWREDESMTDEKMIKMTQEKYPKLSIQRRPKNLCERILENKEEKVIKSLEDYLKRNPNECVDIEG